MKQIWQDLDAKKRRIVVVVLAVAVFSVIVAILPGSNKERERSAREEPVVRAVLTDRNIDDTRFERLLAQIENMRDENRDLQGSIERLRRDMDRMEMGEMGPRISREMDTINQRIDELLEEAAFGTLPARTRRGDEETEIILGADGRPATDEEIADIPVIQEPSQPVLVTPPEQASEMIWDQPAPVAEEAPARGGRSASDEAQTQGSMRVISRVRSEKEIQEEQARIEAERADEAVYLPPGSIITGTIISGMDAPTGRGARQDPFPSLIRIKHEAILPNRFRADVRECFAIMGGYGDISSERAYLRGETFSCVREDGSVIESSFEAYAVGEDGKAGLRGRLVSKQGQLLAKSLTAGVLQGFSGAFNRVPVPTLSLNDGNQQLYQQAFSGDALQSGAVTGVGQALDRLAQFYIDQAEGMFPVIEIDAGREVEIILVRGGRLAIQ